MPNKPYGKYDDLTPEARNRLRIRSWLEGLVWGAVAMLLMALRRALPLEMRWPALALDLLVLAAMLRFIVLLVRQLAVMSPNPRRKTDVRPPEPPQPTP